MQTFQGKSLLDIYKQAIPFLLNTPEEIRSPRGQKVHEILGAQIRIERPDICGWSAISRTRPYPVQYLKDELICYLACTNMLEDFGRISKFWYNLSDDDKTINSSYGQIVYEQKLTNKIFDSLEDEQATHTNPAPTMNRAYKHLAWRDQVFTQFDWVIQSFKKDKDTRQALMFVASPYYQCPGVKDFICTLNYHFIIDSNDRLNMIVNRRSQDIHFGMTFDMPWESVLMQIVLHEVKKMYPEVSLGAYMLNCNSLHMYDRNFDVYTEFADDESHFETCLPPITDNYFKNELIVKKAKGEEVNYDGDDAFLQWLLK